VSAGVPRLPSGVRVSKADAKNKQASQRQAHLFHGQCKGRVEGAWCGLVKAQGSVFPVSSVLLVGGVCIPFLAIRAKVFLPLP